MMRFLKRLVTLGKNRTYDMAMQHYNNQMYRQAIEIFEEILKEKRSSKSLYHHLARFYCGQAHRNLGILLFTLGNFPRAAIEFEKAIQYNPDQMELYHYIGVCLNNLGEFERAVDAFNKILAIDPTYLAVKAKLGVAFHNLKMWDKAISLYNEVLKIQPDLPDIQYRLGLAHLGQGLASEAAVYFQKALDLNSQYLQARIKLGLTHAYLGNFDEAIFHLSVVLDKFPRYADIYHFLGIIHACRNQFSEAIDCFHHALEINPNFNKTRVKLGILLCRMKRFDEGLNQLEQAQAFDSENKNLEMTISLLKRRYQLLEGRTLHDFPDVVDWISRDESYFAQAVREMNKNLEIHPDFPEIISMIKKFPQEDISLYEILIPLMEDYIGKHPDHPDLHNDLGMLYGKVQRYEHAEISLRKALHIHPFYTEARFNLFNILRAQGKFKEALEEGQALHEGQLIYPDFYCGLGEIYLALGRVEDAYHILQEALVKNPDYGQAHLLLAMVHEKQGRKDQALVEIQKCMDANPPQTTYNMARKLLRRLKGKT
ncbi:MAG: tetratricopeptide repeat protein [Pseudomonadota bacterium]